jgi:hypothetical protein
VVAQEALANGVDRRYGRYGCKYSLMVKHGESWHLGRDLPA